MLGKLQSIEDKYVELNNKASDPEVISDQNLFRDITKEISELAPIVEKFQEYKKCADDRDGAK